MNIHHYNGQPISTDNARKMGFSVRSGKGTDTPRTRTGTNTSLAHNAYPGGKISRKRQAALKWRIDGKQRGKSPDRLNNREETAPWGTHGFTKPGSMRG